MDADLLTSGRTAQSCPRCGAAARGEVTWCTQCYLDLRPAPAAASAVPRTASAGVVLAKHAVPEDSPAPTWPCPCGTANPFEEAVCGDCGSAFLSRLRSDDAPSLVLPLVGDVARFSRNQRLIGACGAALLFSLLFALVGLLL